MTLGLMDLAFVGGLAGTSAPTDPYFSNVSLLLHGDGINGSTTILDSSPTPKTVIPVGNAQISTTDPKFGTGSVLLDGNGDYLRSNVSPFNVRTSAFTAESWVKISTRTKFCLFSGSITAGQTGGAIYLLEDGGTVYLGDSG